MNANTIKKTSLKELDKYVDDLMSRNPEWVEKIEQIVASSRRGGEANVPDEFVQGESNEKI